jgi:hypothetical protein
VTEFFGQLRDAALGSIRSFIQERMVMAGITQLLSLLNPVGAVIQAILKTYTTIQFFIQRINQILDLVESIVNSIAAIASGSIGAAANFIERTMARTIPVILDFLARFIGLGDIGGQVQRTIQGLQARVDQMLDRAVDWIRNMARNFASRALGGDPNAPSSERIANALREAVPVVNRYGGRMVGAAILRPLLVPIKLRYRLTRLDVVAQGDIWLVDAAASPGVTAATTAKVAGGVGSGDSRNDPIPLPWVKPAIASYPGIQLAPRDAVAAERARLHKEDLSPAEVAAVPGAFRASPRSPRNLGDITIGVTHSIGSRIAPDLTFQAGEKVQGNTNKDQFNRVILRWGYNRRDNERPPTDGDHVLEKQLGGPDAVNNVWPLNSNVNQESGRRIRLQLNEIKQSRGLSSLNGKWIILKF